MSVSLSGSAGDLRITFYAHIDHQDGQRIVELDALEQAANERLMQQLLSDPTLADLLDSFQTTSTPATQPHDEAGHCPSNAETSVLQHTPEPAPRQRADADTAQQGEATSDRGQDTSNDAAMHPSHRAPATGGASAEDSTNPDNNQEANDQETEGLTVEPSDSQSPNNPSPDKKPDPRNQPKSENPKSLLYETVKEEGFKASPKGKRPKKTKGSKKPRKPKMRFTPTPQRELPQYSCPNIGHRYLQAAQPEGKPTRSPGPCDKCDACMGARRHEKMEQYAASKPSPVSTVLECDFPTFFMANDFATLDKHKNWIPEARRCTLFNALHEYALGRPWKIRLILDSPASVELRDAIEQHAINAGARNVSVTETPVSPGQFMAWLPHQFSMKKGPKSHYNLCRFSNGWAQKEKTPSDNRKGKTERLLAEDSDTEIFVTVQIERATAITKSWKETYNLSNNKDVPPERRRELRKQARRELQRARQVAFTDWLRRWETLHPEYIDRCRKFIDEYRRGEKPSAAEWQAETKGPRKLVVETARWLNGARDVEPAFVTVAQRLGYIPEGEHPAVDVAYLTQLTRTLPPLEFYDEPYVLEAFPEEFDPFDDYAEMAA